MKWLKNPFKKDSLAGIAISQFVQGQVIYTPRDYESLSKEGYIKNVIAYRCVSLIARSVSAVPWFLMKGQEAIERHPVLELINRPNPSEGRTDFMERLAAFYMIAGNVYVEASRFNSSPPLELYTLRPDRVRIIGGRKGFPAAYRYTANGVDVDFDVDPLSGKSNLYHMKTFHPTDDWYGLAPIEAAAFSIDQHNAAGEHNASLLQNRAVPSGTIVFKQNPGDAEMKRVQQLLIDRYSTPKNAGKPMIMGGDAEWKEMGLSPKDLDYNKGVLQVARDICSGFGVPHVLVVPGESTYRNMEEANLMLWEGTVIPLLDKIKEGVFGWLLDFYGGRNGRLSLEYDLDGISALIPRRTLHREAVMAEYTSGIITRNEAREALAYDKAKNGNTFYGEGSSAGKQPAALPEDDTSTPKKNFAPRESKGFLENILTFTAPEEIDDPSLSADITGFLKGVFAKIVHKYGEQVVREIGEKIAFENSLEVQEYLGNSTASLIRNVNDTTKKRIRQQINEAFDSQEGVTEIRQRIEDVFTEASTTRARAIAVTESTRLTGYASAEAIDQSGVEYKEWMSTMDGNTRDAHAKMDGQVVPAGGKFTAPGGQHADHPGGFGIARLDINCRCAIAAAFPEKSAKAMTDQERRELWGIREKTRTGAEKEILESFEKIFTMQRDAVLKKISDITGTA